MFEEDVNIEVTDVMWPLIQFVFIICKFLILFVIVNVSSRTEFLQ